MSCVVAAVVTGGVVVPRAESPTRGALPPATSTARRSRRCVRRPKAVAVVREERETIGNEQKHSADATNNLRYY